MLVTFEGERLDITHTYSRPDRSCGWDGGIEIESAVDEQGVDHWPEIRCHDLLARMLLAKVQFAVETSQEPDYEDLAEERLRRSDMDSEERGGW